MGAKGFHPEVLCVFMAGVGGGVGKLRFPRAKWPHQCSPSYGGGRLGHRLADTPRET